MLDKRHVNIPSPEEPDAELTLFQAAAYARRLGLHVSDSWLSRFYDANKFGNHVRLGKDAKPFISVKALNQLIVNRPDLFPKPKRESLPANQYTVLEIADHLKLSPIEVLAKLLTSDIALEIHQLGYWLVRDIDLPHLQSLLGRRNLDLTTMLAKVHPTSQTVAKILVQKGVDIRKKAKKDRKKSTKKKTKEPQITCQPEKKSPSVQFKVSEAAEFLSSLGFQGATSDKIYYHLRKGEIEILTEEPFILIAEEELEKLMTDKPEWLMKSPRRLEPPEGYLTGVLAAEKYNLNLSRVYCAIKAGFLPAESASPDGAKHQIWFIKIENLEGAVSISAFGDYLRGKRISLEEVSQFLFKDDPAPSDPNETSDTNADQPGWEHFKGLYTGEDGESRQSAFGPTASSKKKYGDKGPIRKEMKKSQPSDEDKKSESEPAPEAEAYDPYRVIGKAYVVLRVAEGALKNGLSLYDALWLYR